MFTIENEILEKARERYDYYKLMSKYARTFGFELKGTFDDIYKELCDVVDSCYDFDIDENGEYTNIDFSDENNLIDLCDLTFNTLYSFKGRCIITAILHDCGYHFPVKKFDILMNVSQYILASLYVFDVDTWYDDHKYDYITDDEERVFEYIMDETEDISIHTLFYLIRYTYPELKRLKPFIQKYKILPGEFIRDINELTDNNLQFIFDCYKAGVRISYGDEISEILDAPKAAQRKFIRECQKASDFDHFDIECEILDEIENTPHEHLQKVIRDILTDDEFIELISEFISEKIIQK